MKKLSFGGALILASVTLTVQAELGDVKKLPAPAKQKVEFTKDIKPLLDKSCTECHSGEKPKGGFRTDTIENLTKGSGSDAAIIPGNSAKSPIVHYVADLIAESEMPPTDKREKYPALTKDQIALLRAWIDQGAK
ncbi:MAG: c-type cytochrome domain-containing protein, partial [Verrucomicrobiota bacterium]